MAVTFWNFRTIFCVKFGEKVFPRCHIPPTALSCAARSQMTFITIHPHGSSVTIHLTGTELDTLNSNNNHRHKHENRDNISVAMAKLIVAAWSAVWSIQGNCRCRMVLKQIMSACSTSANSMIGILVNAMAEHLTHPLDALAMSLLRNLTASLLQLRATARENPSRTHDICAQWWSFIRHSAKRPNCPSSPLLDSIESYARRATGMILDARFARARHQHLECCPDESWTLNVMLCSPANMILFQRDITCTHRAMVPLHKRALCEAFCLNHISGYITPSQATSRIRRASGASISGRSTRALLEDPLHMESISSTVCSEIHSWHAPLNTFTASEASIPIAIPELAHLSTSDAATFQGIDHSRCTEMAVLSLITEMRSPIQAWGDIMKGVHIGTAELVWREGLQGMDRWKWRLSRRAAKGWDLHSACCGSWDGLHLAATRIFSKINVVAYSELNHSLWPILSHRHPEARMIADGCSISEIDHFSTRAHLFCVGWPCMCSRVRRNGSDTVSFENLELILSMLRPLYHRQLSELPFITVLENVPDFLTTCGSIAWHTLARFLHTLPYCFKHQLLCAHVHGGGVAKRRRLFIVGVRRDVATAKWLEGCLTL